MGLIGRTALVLGLTGLAAWGTRPSRQARYDLMIVGGTVIDGTGNERVRADLAITGDRIERLLPVPIDRSLAKRVIDAHGLIVAPGFIDLHAHLDPLLQMPDAQSAVR